MHCSACSDSCVSLEVFQSHVMGKICLSPPTTRTHFKVSLPAAPESPSKLATSNIQPDVGRCVVALNLLILIIYNYLHFQGLPIWWWNRGDLVMCDGDPWRPSSLVHLQAVVQVICNIHNPVALTVAHHLRLSGHHRDSVGGHRLHSELSP